MTTGHRLGAGAYLLHHLLEASALSRPGADAVVDRERSITYGELDRRSGGLAGLLMALGVERGDRVGLYLDKSLESIVGVYGVLKAGAAYVPLDPHAPVGRLGYIAQDCGVRVLLSERAKAGSWDGLLASGAPLEAIVALDASPSDVGVAPPGVTLVDAAAIDDEPLDRSARSIDLDLAYILYTSGSTGMPKGVMLSHLNALTFVKWAADRFSVGPDDRLSSHAPLHFDLSVFDVFAAAAAGATLVLVPPQVSLFAVEVVRFIERNSITVWYSVPSILSAVSLRGGLQGADLPSLRAVLFAGEVFPTRYLRHLMTLLPHVRFHNLYGPTETNVCTHYEVPALPEHATATIPIGRAIANVEVFVVTDDGRRADRGETGELCVRGNSVMNGYWGDPDGTARSLAPNPFGQGPNDPVYRTGDLAVEDGSGDLRFLGRRDTQIKSRGYRIELGEVEAALYAHPSVMEVAVVAVPDPVVSNRIKAYVTTKGDVHQRDLVHYCVQRIPKYMIPEVFEFRDSLPKTSTGKIDRQALGASAQGIDNH